MTVRLHPDSPPIPHALLLRAFEAGVAYHDALMRFSRDHDEKRGGAVQDDDLDELFEAWHDAIAEALGVEP